MKTTVSTKRTPTKIDEVLYKEVFNSDGKVVDKRYYSPNLSIFIWHFSNVLAGGVKIFPLNARL